MFYLLNVLDPQEVKMMLEMYCWKYFSSCCPPSLCTFYVCGEFKAPRFSECWRTQEAAGGSALSHCASSKLLLTTDCCLWGLLCVWVCIWHRERVKQTVWEILGMHGAFVLKWCLNTSILSGFVSGNFQCWITLKSFALHLEVGFTMNAELSCLILAWHSSFVSAQ